MGARHRTSTTAAGAAILLSLAAGGGIIGAQAAGASTSGRTPLPGSAVTASARQHAVGAVAKSAQVDFEVVLKLRDASGAQSLVRAISSPGSASYRHYLTAAQWESRFSPTTSEVSSVRAWLASEGFTVGAVSKDRITISGLGTAAQVEKAFGTTLNNYKLHGHTVRMAASDDVGSGLDQRQRGGCPGHQPEHRHARRRVGRRAAAAPGRARPRPTPFPPAPAAFITAPPCGSYYWAKIATVTPPFGQGYPNKVPYQVCGYKPGQFRSAYNIGSASTGKGVTVAVIDAYGSSTIASDATRYFEMNDPGNPFANAHFSQLNSMPFDQRGGVRCFWLADRAGDRRRVRARDGAERAHPLCRRPGLHQRPVQRRAERHRQRTRQRGHQLVGRRRRGPPRRRRRPGRHTTTCSCWPTRPG